MAKNELTIILTPNKLIVFDELCGPLGKTTILNGDNDIGGEIITGSAESIVNLIHSCMDAREEGSGIEAVLDDGRIIPFN